MKFDVDMYGVALKMMSTISGGILVGGSLYINVVESPARMTHDAESAITMWKPSFIRAKSFQSKMCMLSGLSSLGVYGCLRNSSPSEAFHWLAAGCGMLTILPISVIFIFPLSSQLVETEKCISVKGSKWIVENLNHWNKIHSIRTFISLGAFSFMVYSLVKK